MDVELLALVHQRVPDFDRVVPGHPNLISQITGIAGTRDIHRDACNFAVRHAKIFQIRDVRFRNRLQQLARSRPLQRQRGDFLRNVLDLHVHVEAVLTKPAQAGIGSGPAIHVLLQPGDSPVVDDFSLLVAPAAVNHLTHRNLVDIAGDYAVHQFRRIFPRDQVLV